MPVRALTQCPPAGADDNLELKSSQLRRVHPAKVTYALHKMTSTQHSPTKFRGCDNGAAGKPNTSTAEAPNDATRNGISKPGLGDANWSMAAMIRMDIRAPKKDIAAVCKSTGLRGFSVDSPFS